ncbi:MAG: LURP-one-related/scramblase family protein [Haloarculaceae archaeon]
MAETTGDVVRGVDLSDDEYVIRQSLLRNKYAVRDATGETVLRGKQKLLKMKEEFPFTTPDGDPVFRVKAQNVLDIAGDYAIVDEASDDTVAVIEKEFTVFKHVYRVRSPDGDLWATIESESTVVMMLKSVSELLGLIPHTYTITGPDGAELGTISERFSIRDVYDVAVDDAGDAPREALVAAAIAIDALEGN